MTFIEVKTFLLSQHDLRESTCVCAFEKPHQKLEGKSPSLKEMIWVIFLHGQQHVWPWLMSVLGQPM